MAPEQITALASLGTFIVIAVTAIAAVIQLRHNRAANQLAGVLEYIKLWETEAIQHANVFIQEELPQKLRDPSYREELFRTTVDRGRHPELVVADWCEQAGSYIKYGLIAPEQFLDLAGAYVDSMWRALREVVAIRRAVGGQAMYENFEYLAAIQHRWETGHRTGNYPRNVPRLLSESEGQKLAGKPPPTIPERQIT